MKLRQIKTQPLLLPPLSEQSLWAEITGERMLEMRRNLRRCARENKVAIEGGDREWGTFLDQAANMKALGMDVSAEVKDFEPQMRQDLGRFIAAESWWNLMLTAAAMKKVGLPVGEVVEHEHAIRKTLKAHKSKGDWTDLTATLCRMNDVGFDVRRDVRKYGQWVIDEAKSEGLESASWLTHDLKELGWVVGDEATKYEQHERRKLAGMAAEATGKKPSKLDSSGLYGNLTIQLVTMKNAGYDVTREAREHEAGIRRVLEEEAKQGDWSHFSCQANYMRELGLLTAVKRGEAQNEMPPLKRFGGGG